MRGLKKDEYDAIIIGAGIGGLVCGCYLAKAGMKVLIVEKNDKPGGYCTSFEKDGYRFDVCAHGLGGMYKNGNLRKIIDDLQLDIEIVKFRPSDIIITPDYKVSFWGNLNETIQEFQNIFPQEAKNLELFFNFIHKARLIELFRKLKQKTFEQLLSEYFKDERLKKILSFPLGNLGVSHKIASALISTIFYREFMINGGYYPIGGMQALPNSLTKKFSQFGGEILFSKKAEKINIEDNTAIGITLDKNIGIKSKYVVSNCDARQTYLELIGEEHFGRDFLNKIEEMLVSPSAFVVYLGFKDGFDESLLNINKCGALWYISSYDIDNIFLHSRDIEDIDFLHKGFFCSLATLNNQKANLNKKSIYLLRIAPFKNKKFWQDNKMKTIDTLLNRFKKVFPHLSKYIDVKGVATPYDFFMHTLNQKGSACGWAAVGYKNNFFRKEIPQNMFCVGHWVINEFGQSGINSVANNGYNISNYILLTHT